MGEGVQYIWKGGESESLKFSWITVSLPFYSHRTFKNYLLLSSKRESGGLEDFWAFSYPDSMFWGYSCPSFS